MRSMTSCLGLFAGLGWAGFQQAPSTSDKPAEEIAAKVDGSDPITNAASIAAKHPTPPVRILVIGAHPADVFDQSGGTMAHHTSRGDWVGCVVVTHGVRIHDKVISDELFKSSEVPDAARMEKIIQERADVKSKEILRACAILGVSEGDVYFMGVDDAVLLVNDTIIRRLAVLIRKLQPDVVITHFPHEDAGIASPHAATGQMVCHAVALASSVDPGDRRPPHKVTQTFFFGIGAAATRANLWGARGGHTNDIFVDITDVIDKKVRCLDAVASQGYAGAYARKRMESSDGAFGSRVNVPYAEGFISLQSTTHYYLPVSPIDLAHSRESDHDAIRRRSFKVAVP